jgi:hypothetical protein
LLSISHQMNQNSASLLAYNIFLLSNSFIIIIS